MLLVDYDDTCTDGDTIGNLMAAGVEAQRVRSSADHAPGNTTLTPYIPTTAANSRHTVVASINYAPHFCIPGVCVCVILVS